MRIVGRTTCRSAEAGGKTRALLYGPVATGMPVSQRTALVVLHENCKRRFGHQQHSRGIHFFLLFFSRIETTCFWWGALLVERHADQQKQVARLVLCCVVQLQPGCQSRNDLRLSCCALIANDESASNNSLGELFFKKVFFPFLFSRTERT